MRSREMSVRPPWKLGYAPRLDGGLSDPSSGDDLMWRGFAELIARDLCLGDFVASHLKRGWPRGLMLGLAAQTHARNPRAVVLQLRGSVLRFQNIPGRARDAATQGLPRCIWNHNARHAPFPRVPHACLGAPWYRRSLLRSDGTPGSSVWVCPPEGYLPRDPGDWLGPRSPQEAPLVV